MVYCGVKRRRVKRITITTFKLGLFVAAILFIVIPLIFKYSYSIQRGLLFLTFISHPRNVDFKRPEKSGLYGTRNFYITYKDPKGNREISLGAWHILPNHVVRRFAKQLNIESDVLANLTVSEGAEKLSELNDEKYGRIESTLRREFDAFHDDTSQQIFFEQILRDTSGPVIFYLHGNTGSRGGSHRVELYQRLRQLGFHVIAFDYRGYGDSTNIGPSARAVRLDAEMVYQYITNLTTDPILLWGHSLGTGIGTYLMSELHNRYDQLPVGVVLESPFNNIQEEIKYHPFARPFRNLPWFEYTILNPMQANKLSFDSDKWISQIKQPIMILHAEDDRVVPFNLGYKLYRAALDTRPKSYSPIEFHRFAKTDKYGHKHICRAPELSDLVVNFYEKVN